MFGDLFGLRHIHREEFHFEAPLQRRDFAEDFDRALGVGEYVEKFAVILQPFDRMCQQAAANSCISF